MQGYDIHYVLGKWVELPSSCIDDVIHNADGKSDKYVC